MNCATRPAHAVGCLAAYGKLCAKVGAMNLTHPTLHVSYNNMAAASMRLGLHDEALKHATRAAQLAEGNLLVDKQVRSSFASVFPSQLGVPCPPSCHGAARTETLSLIRRRLQASSRPCVGRATPLPPWTCTGKRARPSRRPSKSIPSTSTAAGGSRYRRKRPSPTSLGDPSPMRLCKPRLPT